MSPARGGGRSRVRLPVPGLPSAPLIQFLVISCWFIVKSIRQVFKDVGGSHF